MDEILQLVNSHVVDPFILKDYNISSVHAANAPWSEDYTLTRQFIVLWVFTYIGSMMIYLIFSSITFALFYLDKKNSANWNWDNYQIGQEIWVSTWSLFIMAGMTTVVELYVMMDGGYVYHNISDYGWLYFCISPFIFLIFTDTLIYWIHRGLHWGPLYKIHKLHHKYKETTPYSAFSFHPLDGFAQGFPYHLFVMFFPMHNRLYAFTLFAVGLWTVNIHDRVTLKWWGVNSAAHHTIHHTKFNYNYGQYFTFWDHFYGTFKDPQEYWPYKPESDNQNNNNNKPNAVLPADQIKSSSSNKKKD
jgi:lathosterol oxidase